MVAYACQCSPSCCTVSSPLSTPYLTDGKAALQSSIDIVRYANDLKPRPESGLFDNTCNLPVQASIFSWYRDNLRCEPVDLSAASASLQPAGMAFGDVFDFNAFCEEKNTASCPKEWDDAVLQQLPPVVHAAVLSSKSQHTQAAGDATSAALGGAAATEQQAPEVGTKMRFDQQPDAASRLTHVHDRVGPLARRVAYHYITADTALFQRLGEQNMPGLQSWLAYGPLWPLFINGIRSLGLSRTAAEKGMTHLRGEFASVSDALRESSSRGEVFLSGSAFGAVDLYWASLVAPVLLVQAYEGMHAQYPWGDVHPEMRELAMELRSTLAGRHALACFALYRATYADMPREDILEVLAGSATPIEAKL